MNRAQWPSFLLSSLILFAAACSPAAASVRQATPISEASTSTPTAKKTILSSIQPDQIADNQATSATLPATGQTEVSTATLPATIEPRKSPSPSAVPGTDDPCSGDICTYASPYFLIRPIMKPGNNIVDATYRFGNTQGEMREPHHGVELLNSSGTPVLSAADGVVVVAGNDLDPTSPRGVWPITFYGPYSNFYGNLVVIEHRPPAALLADVPDLPQPVYTLYAHLSEIHVVANDQVVAGQQIGAVGLSGIAEGSHLHFEVRLGENTYESVRNPELWLAPNNDDDGGVMGGIAGRVIDSQENEVLITSGIVLQRLPEGPEAPHDLEFYTWSYEEPALIGQAPWEESFAIGDLPAGLYRLTFAYQGVKQFLVEVASGKLSVATFRVE